MSTAPASAPSKFAKAKKEKEKEKGISQSQQNERLKTVVRRLPPNLPEDLFWQSVQPWITEETTTWKIFYPGKLRKKLNKEHIPSRAYIGFKTEEQVALFSRQYDGHIFRDKNGVESQVVVEFAPYPKIPSDKKKDSRNGTIEKDEDYISFVESLNAAENEPVSLEALIASSQPLPQPKTTPLLEALKVEKSAAKDKEAILRNHAHYKQADATVRKDDKKKAATPAAPPSKSAPEAQTSNLSPSKKAKKANAQTHGQGVAAQASANVANPNNTLQVQKTTTQNSGSSSSSSRPPRPPKTPRPTQQPKPCLPSSLSGTSPASNVTSNDEAAPTQAEPSRRVRPAIPSRQFEAALSIAGLAGSVSDRRRREKEKERTKDSPSSSNIDGNAPAGSSKSLDETSDNQVAPSTSLDGLDADKSTTKVLPPSPKKDKSSRRGNRAGGSGRGGGGGIRSSDATNITPLKIPSILQRSENPTASVPVILPRPTPSDAKGVFESPVHLNNPPSTLGDGANTGTGSRGRGRRGRGGGRGRGGQNGATRGAG